MALLKDDLQKLAGPQLQGQTVSVTHYGVYYNAANKLRSQVSGSVGGLLGALLTHGIASHASKCAPSQMRGGWYAGDELTNNLPPIVVEITVSMAGVQHSVRSVYSPDVLLYGKMYKPAAAPYVKVAIAKADAALAKSLFDSQSSQAQAIRQATDTSQVPQTSGGVATRKTTSAAASGQDGRPLNYIGVH